MEGKIDVFVGGAGTGGTISGVGRYLKSKNPDVKIVCADPFGSILHDLFYFKEIRTKPHSYLVEGIGEDMVPDNVHFDVMDDFVQVGDAELFQLTRKIASKEGLLVGPSCGAALLGAIKYSESGKLKRPSRILSLFPDGGRSYLSKVYSEDWMMEKNLLPSLLGAFKVRDLLDTKAKDHRPTHVSVGTSLKDAIAIMRENGLSQIPAFDGEFFMGLVEMAEVLRVLGNGRLRANETVLHVVKMSAPEIDSAASLAELESILSRDQLVRVKDTGTLITRADLGQFMSGMKEQG